MTAVVAGGVRPGVELDERGGGCGRSGLPLLAACVWPPRHAALYALAHFGLARLLPTVVADQRKLMSCHVCQVGGAVPRVTESWRCLQALFVGLPGLLVVFLVLQVCVATTAAIFSCKAIIRHRSSAHLMVSHTPDTSSCVWLSRTFCGR